MPRREVREDLPAREHRRLEQLGQPHGLGLRALAPDVVAEHQHRALRLAQAPGDRLHRLRARRPRPLDLVVGIFADLRLQPFAMEQLRADREVHGPRGRRGGLAQRADGGHADGRRIRVHLIGAARFLGDGAHRLGLAQPGKGREPAIVLQLGRPVPRDDQQRRAGHLRIEELPGELVRAAHDVGDDDADLAADAVVAVGHRGHQPLVLADHQPVVAILGDGREEAGLRGARVGEQVLHARVLQGLEEEHPAGAGDGLAHGLPRCPGCWSNDAGALYSAAPSLPIRRAGTPR